MRIAICFVVLFACAIPALAQQQSTTVELGAPTYSTQPQSKGYRWIVRGNIYPAGTYTPAPGQPLPRGVCDVPGAEVAPIGQYLISGQSGNAADHTATYVLRLDGKQYVFTGRLEVFEESPGIIGATLFDAALLRDGIYTVTDPPTMVELTPRSRDCFGATARIFSE